MKKPLILLTAMLMSVACISCNDNKNYETIDIGIVKDVNYVSTSFNEAMKTQIKTDSLFLIVYGTPQINIGSKLSVQIDGNTIVRIISNGKKYKVAN